MDKKLGHYAFLVGIVLAIIAGLFETAIAPSIATLILVLLGLIVGFLNITGKETTPFLIAAIALLAAGGARLDVIGYGIGGIMVSIIQNISVFVAPAAIIVALKAIYALAQD